MMDVGFARLLPFMTITCLLTKNGDWLSFQIRIPLAVPIANRTPNINFALRRGKPEEGLYLIY